MTDVRRAALEDAGAVARVLNGVVAERRFTAMDVPVTAEWIAGLGPLSLPKTQTDPEFECQRGE